jgi:hypothetical protein
MIRKDFSEEATFKQRPERQEEAEFLADLCHF